MAKLTVNNVLRIATLNFCLGLRIKKDLVKEILQTNKIDILSIQETEPESNFGYSLLNIPGYNLEVETNTVKSRVAIYRLFFLNKGGIRQPLFAQPWHQR